MASSSQLIHPEETEVSRDITPYRPVYSQKP